MNKIKILYLHSGAELYGADQILLATVSNLDKNKFEPIVLLPTNGPLVDKLKENKIRVEIKPYPIIRRKYFNPKGILKLVHEFFRDSKKICKFVKDEHIDIIHNNTIAVLEGIYIRKKVNIKLITHVHEMIDSPKIVAKFLYKIHFKNCDDMIVVSNAVKKHIENILNVSNNKIKVIHNGIEKIDCRSVDKNKYLKEFNIPFDSKIVAIIGRINAIKGQEHFINAMKKVIKHENNVYGLIIGDAFSGQEYRVQKLKDLISSEKLNDNIIYCGFRKDIKDLYRCIDILTLPSINFDSFPTVVLEAMSCGIPTVAYRCGGVEEMIIEGKNGFLVKQGDYNELAKKIIDTLRLTNNEKEITKIFEDNFNIKKYIKKIENEYRIFGDAND